MPIINDLGTGFLWLIRAGVVTRAVYLLFMIMADQEEEDKYKRRLKQMIYFYIGAESIYQIQALVKKYLIQPSPGTINQISQSIMDFFS